MWYFITLEGEPEFQFNLGGFKDQLSSRWQSIDFVNQVLSNSPMILECMISFDEDLLHIMLHDDPQMLFVDGFPSAVVKFVIWCRKIVPDIYEMFLGHDSWSPDEEVEITTATEEFALLQTLNSM